MLQSGKEEKKQMIVCHVCFGSYVGF